MKTLLPIISSIFIVFSCSRNCHIDKDFKKKFELSIKLIETVQNPNNSTAIEVEKLRETVWFLMAISKIEPTNFDIEHGIHYNADDYKSDISKWKEWYDNNKCNFSIETADSLYKITSSKF